jgi:hypothetical protein
LHDLGGLRSGVHHGHQQGLDAKVQVLLDQGLAHMAVAHGHAGNGVRARVGRNRLCLLQDVCVKSLGACSPSINSQSNPAPAQISVA